jgi:hypothetical protein
MFIKHGLFCSVIRSYFGFLFEHKTFVAPHFATIMNLGRRTGNHKIIDVPLYRRFHDLSTSVMTIAIHNASFAANPVRLVMDRPGPARVVRL